jgi:L-aspartate oxidase
MVEAALLRQESRGAHFRTDFPKPSTDWQKHITFKISNPVAIQLDQ